jgi:hypothetical protein
MRTVTRPLRSLGSVCRTPREEVTVAAKRGLDELIEAQSTVSPMKRA